MLKRARPEICDSVTNQFSYTQTFVVQRMHSEEIGANE